MACCRTPQQVIIPISHLPTAMLVIGTFVYWVELFAVNLPGGHTSWLAWGLWAFLGCVVISQTKFRTQFKPSLMLGILGLLAIIYLAIVFFAALLPPHLVQEFDVINYHYMIPRQHLILQSFAHIPWSVADLFLLPLDYALSPFWLATSLPNKFPQFIFFLGVLALAFQIVYMQTSRVLTAAIATVAVMALHMVAIQAGTAMLDMVMLYCVLASIHSLMKGRYAIAAIEWAFFFWSKSFIPPMIIVIFIAILVLCSVANRFRFSFENIYAPIFIAWKKMVLIFILATCVIALPHLVKSMYYTGTVLYPFGLNKNLVSITYEPERWQWIVKRTQDSLGMKDAYGYGRSVLDFIKHFWLIAVPEKGVNNAFDYPVGLVYLLVIGPFVLSFINGIRARKVPLLSCFIIIWWVLWFMGSQQTRFLLIPMCLMIVVAFVYLTNVSRLLIALLMGCILLEIFSLRNAHQADWGKSSIEVLRPKDQDLLFNPRYKKDNIILAEPDVAFANFKANVYSTDSIFVFPAQVDSR